MFEQILGKIAQTLDEAGDEFTTALGEPFLERFEKVLEENR